jgi:hypothetical protein
MSSNMNMKKYLALITAAASMALLFISMPVSAQTPTPTVTNPTLKGRACEGITGSTGTATTDCGQPGFFGGLVERVINLLSIIIGGIAAIVLVVAGIMYVASGGDPNNTKRAKDAILYAIIGLVVAIAGQGMVRFVIGNI